jgi:hypothetical protein
MGTPRPIIVVENLGVDARPWPKAANVDYDTGRYCFRVGKLDYRLWKWPWPEWIGIPSRETLDDWFALIDDWKKNYKGTYNDNHVEQCIRCMVPYL